MTRKSSLRIAGYILFFLFFTLVFTVVNFPRENLTGTVNGWLSRASNKALSVAEASPSLPLSVRLSGVSLDTEGNRQVLGDAVVSLDFLAFLAGERSVTVRFSGPLGSSRFRVRSGEDGWGVEVKSLTADLGALPFTEGIPFTIDGMAGVSGNLHTKDPSGKLLDGDGKVTGKGIEIKEGLLEPLGLFQAYSRHTFP